MSHTGAMRTWIGFGPWIPIVTFQSLLLFLLPPGLQPPKGMTKASQSAYVDCLSCTFCASNPHPILLLAMAFHSVANLAMPNQGKDWKGLTKARKRPKEKAAFRRYVAAIGSQRQKPTASARL